jgi:hypothetical protein
MRFHFAVDGTRMRKATRLAKKPKCTATATIGMRAPLVFQLTYLWSSRRVAHLIEEETGVRIPRAAIGVELPASPWSGMREFPRTKDYRETSHYDFGTRAPRQNVLLLEWQNRDANQNL